MSVLFPAKGQLMLQQTTLETPAQCLHQLTDGFYTETQKDLASTTARSHHTEAFLPPPPSFEVEKIKSYNPPN